MSCPLEGIQVYVDVRSSDGKANYSLCVSQQLQLLGADIHKTLSNTCTHVVFKDGKMNTRILANKLGLTLVNVLWVERCRETNRKCDESQFPVTDDRVETPVHLRKARTRYRSLQPAADIDKLKVRGSNSKGSKPRAAKPEARRRSGRRSSDVREVPDEGAPLKPKERLNRKLQWPPDHSDVCSEAELAAHEEISQDLKRNRRNGKRKLKKSGIFDTAASNSQTTKSVSSTDLFVVTKTPAPEEPNCEKEDSQFSLYDASQHFERKDYSVTNIINKLDTTIEKAPVGGFYDLYSDSEDEFLSSPSKSKRTCELTNSQKNVMDMAFEFDEVDKNTKRKNPRKSRKQGAASKVEGQKTSPPQKTEDPISVLNSPTKMLTFNSNYKDNSDIVTELDVDIGETDEIVALEQIKSPTVISRKRSKQPKPRMSAAAKKVDVAVSKKKLKRREVGMNRRDVSPGPEKSNAASNILNNFDLEDTKATFESNIQQENVKPLPENSEDDRSSKHTTAKDVHPSKQSGKTDIAKVLQEPKVSSTSEAKESGTGDNKQRRTSKRIRHSSSKLTNPDFVYQAPRGAIGSQDKSLTSKSSEITNIVEETPAELSVPDDKVDELTEESALITRRSHRQRRTNPKYLSELSDSSMQTSCVSDKKPGKRASPQKYTETPESDKCEKTDLSISEYSTTETPVIKKPVKVFKREIKCASTIIMTTTTDTEDSTTETLDRRHPSKRKKTKKAPDTLPAALPKRKVTPDNSPTKVICTTCCHRDDQAMVRTTVRMLSGSVTETVAKETTHVVMGTPKRTINLLKAVIHGAYVLSLDWVTDSISKDSWQKESKYQLTAEFPILKVNGEERRVRAASLFAEVGLIFVEKQTNPPQCDIVELVESCGGKVTRSRTRSRYCVGGAAAQDKAHISLSEQWVLDSISTLRLQDSGKYLLFPYRSPSPEF